MISPNEGQESPPVAAGRLTALTAQIFAEGGWLQGALGLESRPEQEAMARAVAQSMLEDKPLVFEAGTGVGKSLAYLVPGILRATEAERPCVVSTNTIALQEQIQNKDLPLCRALFEKVPDLAAFADFRSAVLVGKGNYLCPTRLATSLANKQELFPTDEFAELQRIADWAAKTRTGLRHELNPPPSPEVWESVNAEGSACSRRNCSPKTCFYQKARAEIRDAQVVIVNHSLLFALINAGGLAPDAKGILLPEDFLVIDEAHTAPEVATEHFGARISSYGLDRQLKGLFNPKRGSGAVRKLAYPKQLEAIAEAQDAAASFFDYLAATRLEKRPIARVSEIGWCDHDIDKPLKAVVEALDSVLSRIEDGPMRDEIKDRRARVHAYYAGIRRFVALAEEDHVHWLERAGRKGQIVTLRSAPIDVAPYLRDALFRKEVSVTLSSATLSVAESMEPFLKRAGAEGAAAVRVESPFDFERHTRIYVAADVPPPSRDTARLAMDAIIDYVGFCVDRVPGGSLVLFTSYSDLRAAASALEKRFLDAGRPFLAQGQGLSRSEIAKAFREAGNGVLFGTDSFWTGIDVPGPALSQVIVTRLPFDVPSHPIAEARAERVREQGGNPFNEITLPEAVVKFRQGVGRLVRTKEDKGLVTILDARVLTKPYGRRFLRSLPKSKFIRMRREDREDRFCDIEATPPALQRRDRQA